MGALRSVIGKNDETALTRRVEDVIPLSGALLGPGRGNPKLKIILDKKC